MSIIRVGSNDKYSSGWDSIFGKGKSAKKSETKAGAKKSTKKPAAAKKKPAKKTAKKK